MHQHPSVVARDLLRLCSRNSLQASLCVFSDRMLAHRHSEFVASHRVSRGCRHDVVPQHS